MHPAFVHFFVDGAFGQHDFQRRYPTIDLKSFVITRARIIATLSRGMRLSLMLIPAFCCPAETPAQQPAWRLDLSNYPKQQIETRAFTNPLPQNTGVAFLDDRTLVAYFIGRASPPSLSVGGERSQFFFRAVFLDSSGGTERSKQDWPADLLSSSFLPAREGSFIVRFGSTLRLYSRDFKSIAEITLPEKEKHEIQRLAISPSGRVLWFIRHGTRLNHSVRSSDMTLGRLRRYQSPKKMTF